VVHLNKRIWNDINKKKPELGQAVLVFSQGYGQSGNYWSDYNLATYIKCPSDKRKKCFANPLQVKQHARYPWEYRGVTHWIELPEKPAKIEPFDPDFKIYGGTRAGGMS